MLDPRERDPQREQTWCFSSLRRQSKRCGARVSCVCFTSSRFENVLKEVCRGGSHGRKDALKANAGLAEVCLLLSKGRGWKQYRLGENATNADELFKSRFRTSATLYSRPPF